MELERVATVRCEIREGRAYLCEGERKGRSCHGACSSCASFLGVDIRQVGQQFLDGDCCGHLCMGPGIRSGLA